MAPAIFSRTQATLTTSKGAVRQSHSGTDSQSLSSQLGNVNRGDTKLHGSQGFEYLQTSATSSSLSKQKEQDDGTHLEDPTQNSSDIKRLSYLKSRSKALLEALLPPSKNYSVAQSEASFEVLRPSLNPRIDERNLPHAVEVEVRRPSELGRRGGDQDSHGPTSTSRRTRQSSNPPSSLKNRGALDALSRRVSALSVTSFVGAGPSSYHSPTEQARLGEKPQGSFKLRSMRNVRHGSQHELDQQQGSYLSLPSGMTHQETAEPYLPNSPPQSPTFADPLAAHDLVAPTSPAVSARRIYIDPSGGGSSISVAKFRAGRNRSESGNFSPPDAHSAVPSSRTASPGPTIALHGSAMSPSEQLAALEAELARGGRATPLLRHLDEARFPRSRQQSVSDQLPTSRSASYRYPESLEGDSACGLSPSTRQVSESAAQSVVADVSPPITSPQTAPVPPEKDQQFLSRQSLQGFSLFTDFAEGNSPTGQEPSRRRYSSRLARFGGTNPSEAFHSSDFGPAKGIYSRLPMFIPPGSDSKASSSHVRGRGMDAASFLRSVGERLDKSRPKTLFDALSQLESKRDSDNARQVPAKPCAMVHDVMRHAARSPTLTDGVALAESSRLNGPMSSPPAPLYTPPVNTVEAGVVAQALRATTQTIHRVPASELLSPKVSPEPGAVPEAAVKGSSALKDAAKSFGDLPTPIERAGTREADTAHFDCNFKGAEMTSDHGKGYFDISLVEVSKPEGGLNQASAASVGTPIPPAAPLSNLIVVNASPTQSSDDDAPQMASQTTRPGDRHSEAVKPAHATQLSKSEGQSNSRLDLQHFFGRQRAEEQEKHASPPVDAPLRSRSSNRDSFGHRKALSVGNEARQPLRRKSEECSSAERTNKQARSQLAPARALTVSGPKRQWSTSSSRSALSTSAASASHSKAAELLSFHAKQARAIAQAQANLRRSSSLAPPNAIGPKGAPPGVKPDFFAALSPSQRDHLQRSHEQAVLAARAAYQETYDRTMEPVIASLPPDAQATHDETIRSQGATWNPSLPTRGTDQHDGDALFSRPGSNATEVPNLSGRMWPNGSTAKLDTHTTHLAPPKLFPSNLQPPSSPVSLFSSHTAHTISRSSNVHRRRASTEVSDVVPTVELARRPSAKFMAPPAVGPSSQPPLPAIDGCKVVIGNEYRPGQASLSYHGPGVPKIEGSATLTDELKRLTAARGGEPGAYSATKRDLD